MDILSSEVRSGRLAVPSIAMRYTLRGHSAEGAVPLAVLHVPFATAESMRTDVATRQSTPCFFELLFDHEWRASSINRQGLDD